MHSKKMENLFKLDVFFKLHMVENNFIHLFTETVKPIIRSSKLHSTLRPVMNLESSQ